MTYHDKVMSVLGQCHGYLSIAEIGRQIDPYLEGEKRHVLETHIRICLLKGEKYGFYHKVKDGAGYQWAIA